MRSKIGKRLMTFLSIGLGATLTLGLATTVVSAGPYTGYAVNSAGELVHDSDGDCVRTSNWRPALAIAACEPDADGDGVPDVRDECPGTPKGAEVDDKGCAIDSDGDGVVDSRDQCPGTPEGVEVDAQGCALDDDGDGVPNYRDECPGTEPGMPVNDRGCVVDSDGDGVVDANDECPGTPAGTPVDDRGCALEAGDIGTVNFPFDKSTLDAGDRSTLRDAVEQIKAAEDATVKIAGHTDSIGTQAYNMGLSRRRADAVKAFLTDHGVSAGRIETRGYGEREPVATNETARGRAKNRRAVVSLAH